MALSRPSVVVASCVAVGTLLLPTTTATARPDAQPQPTAPSASATAPVAAAQWGECSIPDLEGMFDLPELLPGEPAVVPEGYECALYPVPLDHADPQGPTIDLALIKRPADDPASRQGTIFYNPGGPGESGFESVLFAGEALLDPAVSAQFDLVGFDPRGVARSAGLDCATELEQTGGYYPFFWPETREDLEVVDRTNEAVEDACRRDGGPVQDNMSTTDVADDLELLRQAVGDEQLNFFGVSYGSYLGALYANRYPDHAGAIVVDAILDPVDWATGRDGDDRPLFARVDSDVGAQATLEEFFRLCDEAGPARCSFAGNSAARFADLHAALQQDPVVVALPGLEPAVIDHQLLTALSLQSLYSTFQWPFLADTLVLLELVQAGASLLDVSGVATLGTLDEVVEVPDHVGAYAQTFAVACADGVQPPRVSDWQAAAEGSIGYFGPLWTWQDGACEAYDVDTSGVYRGPFDRQTANPVLVLNTTYDPATDISGALALRNLMPSSRLVTVEGWGHSTIGLSLCAEAVRTQYFLTREVPAEDVTCQQDLPVFLELELEPEPEPPAEGSEVGTLSDPAAETRLQQAEEVLDPELAELLRRREVVLEHAGTQLPAATAVPGD